jgi:hypothetical protein
VGTAMTGAAGAPPISISAATPAAAMVRNMQRW